MSPFQQVLLLISLSILLPANLWAQEPGVLTPEESVQRALEEHGLLRSAEAQAREARAAYRQARSAWWPSISSQASYTRLSGNIPPIGGQLPGVDTTFTIAPVELNRYHTEISVEQPLFKSNDVLQVPTSALFRTNDGWAVFVIENGVATRRRVEVGHQSGLTAQIVSDLEDGEEVIVHPSNELEDGVRVERRDS